MLSVKNLKLKLGKKQVLNNVSFTAENGSITVLLGRNGSGKTTLLRALSSELLKYSGEVEIDGKNIKSLDKKEKAELVSFLPQALAKPAISIEELVGYGRYPYRSDFVKLNDNDLKTIDSALEKTGLSDKKEELVCHLSYGQRQLAYFALMLAKDSEIMLLDEPTSNLDSSITKMLYETLKQQKSLGKCIVMSMHDINDALEVADNIVVLKDGGSLYTGDKEGFVEEQLYKEIFDLEKKTLTDENGNKILLFK